MENTTGPFLPSREDVQPSIADGALDVTLPSAGPAPAHPAMIEVKPRTRAERMRMSTLRGGLDALPEGFDDADGDWQCVSSASLFERLYLDAAQHLDLTPSIVQKNYGVLSRFWAERIALMQTGGAKTQILRKFGGPHRSEELVLSYPRELKKAADRLSTPHGIASHYEELQVARRAAARNALEPILAIILANDSVEPAETDSFFQSALAAGLEIGEAATLLHDAIVARDFEPVEPPRGDSLPERLRSVQWASRHRIAQMRAVAAPSLPVSVAVPVAAVPLPLPAPQMKSGISLRTLMLASLLVIAAIVLAATFIIVRPRDVEAQQIAPEPIVTELAPSPIPKPATGTITIAPEPPRVDTAAEELERLKREAAEREQERLAAEELERARRADADRRNRETERIARLRTEVVDAIAQARHSSANGDYDSAQQSLEDARGKAMAEAASFATELTQIDALRRDVDQVLMRLTVLRSRLGEIDALNDGGRYPEAISLANRLLKEPGLPAPIAALAQQAVARAQEEMKKLFKDSELRDVRTRRTKGRN